MTNLDRRASWLSGFWALLTGGAAIAVLLVILDPVSRQEDCPNYGAAGNASAFHNPDWDLYFPLVLLSWLLLIFIEQLLPLTHGHRGVLEVTARGVCAFACAIVCSCCMLLQVAAVCH